MLKKHEAMGLSISMSFRTKGGILSKIPPFVRNDNKRSKCSSDGRDNGIRGGEMNDKFLTSTIIRVWRVDSGFRCAPSRLSLVEFYSDWRIFL